jgi:hypothetical protein
MKSGKFDLSKEDYILPGIIRIIWKRKKKGSTSGTRSSTYATTELRLNEYMFAMVDDRNSMLRNGQYDPGLWISRWPIFLVHHFCENSDFCAYFQPSYFPFG